MLSKKKVKARNVLFVDVLRNNLLSVIQMCDHGHEDVFRSNNYVVRNMDTDKIIIKGARTLGNVYVSGYRKENCYISKFEETRLSHKRFGHLNFSQLYK